jgi:hypothetical protein
MENTMIITVHAPEDRAPEYLRLIADQLEDDYSSGHYDQDTYWETVDDACNDPEVLGRIFSHRGQ